MSEFRKLLVTGGAGFIGSAVVRLAVARGHAVINLDALTYTACEYNVAEVSGSPLYAVEHADIHDAGAFPVGRIAQRGKVSAPTPGSMRRPGACARRSPSARPGYPRDRGSNRLDARHAHAAPPVRMNKSDENDARGSPTWFGSADSARSQ